MRNRRDAIAVVGISCRFPGGAETPEAYWQLLKDGRDVVSKIDDRRWSTEYYYHPNPKTRGRAYTWSAGLLDKIDQFDAAFFGISPREAAEMDPQQRILLELAWEALEDGGQPPQQLAGSDCAVYVGVSSTDYANSRLDDPSSADAYVMTGGTLSIAANRISYAFDLHGPSMSIDTACSSSLVALHQACQTIWRGEASCALAGGVNVLMTPFNFIGFAKASMLSPTGHCRAFDAKGDGYVRAEGGSLLFLKPLAQAKKDGDPIHAVIVGSAVNSDGRTKGLSMPSADAQAQLLQTAYAQAGVEPASLAYLEAHGTGTPAGDPQEAGAIGRVLGSARGTGDPLRIGSAKTNVGHLEPASGMAGLLKVVLALKHRAIPASLHFETPNPNIAFDELNLRVVTEFTKLEDNGGPAVMGVNSFGFGGTNAHVVLREWCPPTSRRTVSRRRKLLPLLLSARSPEALTEMAGRYRQWLLDPSGPSYGDIAHTVAKRRQAHDHRLAVYGRDPTEVAERLEVYRTEGRGEGIVVGEALARPAKLALVFSGNGCQWAGMGRRLLKEDPVFRATVENIDELLSQRADFSVIAELRAKEPRSRFQLTEFAQPALFALQVGMLESLTARGLEPGAVIGHSVGEVAAAYAAGALTLEQAVRVIHERSTAQGRTRGQGTMAAIAVAPAQALELIDPFEGELELAAVNSPTSVTISGGLQALERLGEGLDKGTFFRILDLDYAFHNRVMDPIQAELVEALEGLVPTATSPGIDFVSTVSGERVAGESLDPHYWWENVRRPVRMDHAIATLFADGYRVFLEIGAHPIMQSYVRENARAANVEARPVATLKRGDDSASRLWESLCGISVLGCDLNVERLFGRGGQCVSLPRYPWQRESFWYESTNEALGVLGTPRVHPLLGFRLKDADWTWENQIDTERFPFLADHVVGGAVVFPAAGFVEMALAASFQRFGGERHELETFEIRAPMVLDAGEVKTIRLTLDEGGSFSIRSRSRLSDQSWSPHVTGRLAGACVGRQPARLDAEAGMGSQDDRISARDHYRCTESLGLAYGPAFQAVAEVRVDGSNAWARIAPLETLRDGSGESDKKLPGCHYHLHPCVLDASLQVLADLGAQDDQWADPVGFLPFQIGRFLHFGSDEEVCYCHVRIRRRSVRSIVADIDLADAAGNTIAQMEGFRFRRMRLLREGAGIAHYAYRPELCTRRGDGAADHLPRPTDIAEHLVPELAEQWYVLRRADHYGQVMPLFDALSAAFAHRAIKQLLGSRNHFTLNALLAASRVDARHAPLLSRLIGMLEEDGMVIRDGAEWVLQEGGELSSPEEIWRLVLADFPAYLPEAVMSGRCGMALPKVLRGEVDPAEILSPTNALEASQSLYEGSPSLRITNQAMREALSVIIAESDPARRLRVLEISAGALGLTTELVELMPAERSDYVFTSADANVQARAQAQLAEHRVASVTGIDLEGDLLDQELAPNSFDVVIATYGLHLCKNLGAALANIRWLLGRDGLLLMLERPPERLTDIVYGVQPDWWARTTDVDRPRARLLSQEEWRAVLADQGFEDTVPLSEPAPEVGASSYLLIARNPEHTEVVSDASLPEPQVYMILADQAAGPAGELAMRATEALRGQGHRVVVVTVGARFVRIGSEAFALAPDRTEDFERMFAILDAEGLTCNHIVHLMGIALDPQGPEGTDVHAAERRCLSVVNLVRACASMKWRSSPQLWLATSGATALSGGTSVRHAPAEAALWGLGRVLMNEHPELHCRLLDLPIAESATTAQALLAELHDPDDEEEVLATTEGRFGLRLDHAEIEEPVAIDRVADEQRRLRLDFPTPGPLTNLRWESESREPPGPGQLEIRVQATGLNFRDVMYAMGMLSDEAVEAGFAGPTLGMECSGDVVAVGSGITGFKVGDPVICFAKACFATYITTETTAVAHKPAAWSYEAAATIATTFFTVYYGLNHLSGLGRGERILIHGAAGGVGMAAIQYARYCEAEIFATAGSDLKRDFLRLLGVDHVLDSRDLAFAEQIMQITDGEGVNVVLNSLSGEAMTKSLSVLKPFGRFLELGKRDFYENSKVGMRPFRNNISYFAIDADQLLEVRSELAGRLFREMMGLFEQGAFRPLVHQVFPAHRVADAFRCMQQSSHIGKVVVTYEAGVAAAATAARPRAASLRLAPQASYLVTGGLSGFGLATAEWLADRGAQHLVLLGRSGAASEAAEQAVAALRQAGVRVLVCKADVSDREALQRVFNRIDRELPTLKGVFHAAMVLQDALVLNQDADSLRTVFNPKALGAWNLHELTRERTLDHFVLFSSATTAFGNPGQSNYVAANLYLESLVEHRRAQGLPGIAVGWGPISDVGYLARNQEVRDALGARIGGKPLTAAKALSELEQLLVANGGTVAVASLDWRTLRRMLPAVRSTRFSALGAGVGSGDDASHGGDDIRELIAGLSDTEAQEIVAKLMAEQVSKVLRLPADKLDLEASIYDLGMDSLMAVELHMGIEDRFNVHVPVVTVTEGASVLQMAARIVGQLSGRAGGETSDHQRDRDTLARLIAQHGESFSQTEVNELIDGVVGEQPGAQQGFAS